RCLDSLAAAQVSFGKIHIVVIDNGSLVEPREDVIKRVPEVDFLRLEHNVGYAAGCNLGAGRALSRGANFILFLNNDTVITPSLFEDLLTCFSRNPEVGIASPLIYDMSETPRIDFAGGHVNFALGRFSHRRQPPKEREPFETGYVSGCCMMISKTVIDRVGLFDEK